MSQKGKITIPSDTIRFTTNISLSEFHLKIFEGLANGETVEAIADTLGVAVNKVRHTLNIFRSRFDLPNVTTLMTYLSLRGIFYLKEDGRVGVVPRDQFFIERWSCYADAVTKVAENPEKALEVLQNHMPPQT